MTIAQTISVIVLVMIVIVQQSIIRKSRKLESRLRNVNNKLYEDIDILNGENFILRENIYILAAKYDDAVRKNELQETTGGGIEND